MRPVMLTALIAAATCALAAAVIAAPAPSRPAGAPPRAPQVKYSYYRLANGLRVILSVDHSAPVAAVSVTYDVGSRNERPGRTGFAHLFEHMMFQGSQNVGKGEHMLLVQDNGGTLNGSTNQDRTNYFEALPANQLDLALYLESDRMRSLDISQANLDNQRAVVQEERRQSYDNQPYGAARETVDQLAYSSFAYQHSTIGSMEDLNAATLDDVRQFFRTYYAPNNAAIAIVGDFNEAAVRRKVQRYFGDIARQQPPPLPDIAEQPLGGEKRKDLIDPLARLTLYQAAYRTVPGDHPDAPALQILGSILSRGRTGRLYAAIVEKRLALSAMAGAFPSRGPGLFSFTATLPAGATVDALERAWDSEVSRVQTDGVSDAEMRKAVTQARAAAIVGGGGRRGGGGFGGLQTALGRANALSLNAIFYDDPNRVNTALDRLAAVTAADVKRVANQYLQRQNRVVVIANPAEEPDMPFAQTPSGEDRKGAF